MLGRHVDDPEGMEDKPGKTKGLGLLPVKTVIQSPKTTTLSSFSWNNIKGEGYEIHMGYTERIKGSALFKVNSRNKKKCCDFDGCITDDGKIAGTYMHGMFDSVKIRMKWLHLIGIKDIVSNENQGENSHLSCKDKDYTLLKEHFEKYVNFKKIMITTGIKI